jgi:hypothetical protein
MLADRASPKVEGLAERFSGVAALDDATLAASAREAHGVCAENGAGSGSWRADALRLPFGSKSRFPASSLDHNCGNP